MLVPMTTIIKQKLLEIIIKPVDVGLPNYLRKITNYQTKGMFFKS